MFLQKCIKVVNTSDFVNLVILHTEIMYLFTSKMSSRYNESLNKKNH